MPEVTVPREDHRHTGLVGTLDGEVVANRAARLDERRDASIAQNLERVGEGQERVTRGNGALGLIARLLEHLGSATRAHDLDAKLIDEGTREILDTRFIGE